MTQLWLYYGFTMALLRLRWGEEVKGEW